jgi:hypothetical protein
MFQRFWNVMNPQTRIIVVTAAILVAIDIALRLAIPARVVHINQNVCPVDTQGGVLTVRALQIADDNGNVRATLDLDEGNEPALKMYDNNDTLRLQLDTMQTVPSLMFFDQQDQRTMYLGNGTPNGATYLDRSIEYDPRAIGPRAKVEQYEAAKVSSEAAKAGQTIEISEINECRQ